MHLHHDHEHSGPPAHRERTGYHVAQINIATLIAATDDDLVAEFMGNLDRINAIADSAPGFVWRLKTDEGNATSIKLFENPLEIVNMSVWTSLDALRDYVFNSPHRAFVQRRAEWFVPGSTRTALWFVPEGTIPDVHDGIGRAQFMAEHGPSPYAFSFARPQRPFVIEETTLDDDETQLLVARLNLELTELADDPSENHFTLDNDEITGDNGRMIKARYDDYAIGCGAIRRIGPTVGELKRMYVEDEVRGFKIGAAILFHLEGIARQLGLTEIKLETGPRQEAANALYQHFGYERCEPWGEYIETAATSLCYRKVLP